MHAAECSIVCFVRNAVPWHNIFFAVCVHFVQMCFVFAFLSVAFC